MKTHKHTADTNTEKQLLSVNIVRIKQNAPRKTKQNTHQASCTYWKEQNICEAKFSLNFASIRGHNDFPL